MSVMESKMLVWVRSPGAFGSSVMAIEWALVGIVLSGWEGAGSLN